MARPTAKEDICNLSLDYLKQSPLNSITTPVTNSEYIFARWYDIERQAALRAHPWKFAMKRATLNPDPITTPLFGYLYAYDLPNDYIRKVSIGNDYNGDLKQEIEIENGQILTSGGSDKQWNTATNPASPAIASWSSVVNYVPGNQVVYSGFVYVCSTANINQEPDLNPGAWQQIVTPNQSNTVPQTLYIRYIYDMQVVAQMDPLFIEVFALGMAIDLSPKFSVAATAVDRLMKIFEEKQTEARAANGQDNPPKRIQISKRLQRRRGYQYNIFSDGYTRFGY